MKKSPLLAVLFFAGALISPFARGQNLDVDGGTTNTIASGTNPYQFTRVGFATSSNQLNILNAGTLVTNIFNSFIGLSGSTNRLVISNGGKLADALGYIGFDGLSSNNTALVTGPGSTWSNRFEFAVGESGNGNSLEVADGASVISDSGYVGRNTNAANNRALVTGPGSIWTNSDFLFVGDSSSGNNLVVSNDGMVASSLSIIGLQATASNNTALVTGTNSSWISSSGFDIGTAGSGNSLVISNGALVRAAFSIIGKSAGSNNRVLVTGADSTWTNTSFLYVGGNSTGNSLEISNEGRVINADGYVGEGSNSSNNRVLVTGSNSVWTNSRNLYVGYDGSGNSLVISNSAMVANTDGFIGYDPQSTNNSVLVTGASSRWTNSGGVFVGYEGSGNSLVISSGATVANTDGYIGNLPASSNNSVLVTGANSTWTNSGSAGVIVGFGGSNNTLTVADGGAVSASSISIASVSGSGGTLNIGRFGTNDAGGTINAPTIAFGAGTGVINFNQSDTVTVSSAISSLVSGSGAVNQRGTGRTILSGANDSYSGSTTVSAGTLVAQSQTALGTGTVSLLGGSLELQSPLDIDTLIWNPAARVTIQNPGLVNFLNVTNSFTLAPASGTNYFNFTGSPLSISNRLLAAPGLSTNTIGVFGVEGVNTNAYELVYIGDELWLLLIPQPAPVPEPEPAYPDFTAFAGNPNQMRVAKALNQWVASNPSGDRKKVLDALVASGDYQNAFDQMMPSAYAAVPTLAFNQANALNTSMFQRMWMQRINGTGFSTSGMRTAALQGEMGGTDDMQTIVADPERMRKWGAFVDGNGIFATANSAGVLQDYKSQSGGVAAGASYKWNENFSTGVYVGYQGLQAQYDNDSRLIDNAVRFGGFGTLGIGGWYLNGLVGGAWHTYDVDREIEFGTIDRTARGNPDAGEFDLALATGYDIKAGNFTFGPVTSLQYTYVGVQGFQENGADSLDLDVDPYNASSLLYSLGAQVAYRWEIGKNFAVTPMLSASWQHEFLQNAYPINAAFNTGGPASPFMFQTSQPQQDYFMGGAGVGFEIGETWDVSFFWNAVAGNADLVSQNIYLSIGAEF